VGSAVMTVLAQHGGGALKSLGGFPLPSRLANAVDATAAYLGQTVWPADMVAYYPYPRSGLPPVRVAAEGALLLGITVLAACLARKRPYLLMGWLWFLVTLAPVIGVVQVGQQARADRYTYIPHIGLFLAAVWCLWDL